MSDASDAATGPVRYRVVNETRGVVLAQAAGLAANPITRAIGLIGRKSLPAGGGLVIRPCSGVVSFFMRFAIDVVFLDANGAVCYQLRSLVPWRMSKFIRGSKLVVELPAGTLASSGTELLDRVALARV